MPLFLRLINSLDKDGLGIFNILARDSLLDIDIILVLFFICIVRWYAISRYIEI